MEKVKRKRHWREAPKTLPGPGASNTNAGDLIKSSEFILSPFNYRGFSFLTFFKFYVRVLIKQGEI
jgi:hypothetical protein